MQHHGHGGQSALPLSAGKLEGISAQNILGAVHGPQKPGGEKVCFPGAKALFLLQQLPDLAANGANGIQRGNGILDDDADGISQQLLPPFFAAVQQLLSLIEYFPGMNA